MTIPQLTPRVQSLRQMLAEKSHHQYRQAERKLALDLTPSVAKEPTIVRKALAVKMLLETMPVYIQEQELIVGGRTILSLPSYYTPEELNDRVSLESEGYDEIFDRVYNHCQDERGFGSVDSVCPGHFNVLAKGFLGIRNQAQRRLKSASGQAAGFYRAVIIVCDAVVAFAERYAQEAERLATEEKRAKRRRELLAIAEICRQVPARPASSFHEALQAIFFTHLIAWAEGHYLVMLGRFDQYVQPFYRRDLNQGTLTRDQARELLHCLWIKLNCDGDLTHTGIPGDTGQTMTLGGKTRTGRDATNEVSYLALEATAALRVTEPQLVVRLHPKSPEPFITQACELSSLGMGFPLFCNDEVIIPAAREDGYRLGDARDYCVAGCWEVTVAGRANDRANSGRLNFLRCVEWALSDGHGLRDVEYRGTPTGSLSGIGTFDDLMVRVKQQISYYVDRIVANCGRARFSYAPYLSATMDDCLAKGADLSSGGCRYSNTGVLGSGLANAADSLTAIKKIIFDDQDLSLAELTGIVRDNFSDHEPLRQRLLRRIPKFGNDDDEPDQIAAELAAYYASEVRKHQNGRGGIFRPILASSSDFVSGVKRLGASADGRKLDEPLGSNISPAPGRARKGPTAVLNSANKIDQKSATMGAVLDLKFTPSTIRTPKGIQNLKALLLTYFDREGVQIHFNVVSDETLRAAQRNPELYSDLLVRVYGFSAVFVALDRKTQDQIISRASHEL